MIGVLNLWRCCFLNTRNRRGVDIHHPEALIEQWG